jgi:hypothetical protein
MGIPLYVVSSVFPSGPNSSVASNKVHLFVWYLCFCLVNYHQHRPETHVSHSFSVPTSWLMAYSKVKLERNAKKHIFVSDNSE